MSKKEWLRNRVEKVALDIVGKDYYSLGPHMQAMCYAKAEEDWIDYYSSLIDSIHECEKYRRLGC